MYAGWMIQMALHFKHHGHMLMRWHTDDEQMTDDLRVLKTNPYAKNTLKSNITHCNTSQLP